MKQNQKISEKIKDGIIRGIGWSLGVTFGFALISLIVAFILNRLGGLPIIGDWIATLVKVTQDSLRDQAPSALTQ